MVETFVTAVVISSAMMAIYNFMLSWMLGELEKPTDKVKSKVS